MNNQITAYLDGSLNAEKRSEFEAQLAVNPELNKELHSKAAELENIRLLIPEARLSGKEFNELNREIKTAVFELLRVEPKTFWERLNNKYEEWVSR